MIRRFSNVEETGCTPAYIGVIPNETSVTSVILASCRLQCTSASRLSGAWDMLKEECMIHPNCMGQGNFVVLEYLISGIPNHSIQTFYSSNQHAWKGLELQLPE